jgi:ABC-type lipopolysaccharide export system ATPase subunit
VDADQLFGGPANHPNPGAIVAAWPIQRALAAIYISSCPHHDWGTKGEAYMPAIEVRNLRKRDGGHVGVQDVSFTVERGEIFGIIGPNGAGKTTTVECIEGLRTPDDGPVSVLGLDPRRDRAELRQRVGAQLQESALPEKIKVWEALDLHSSFYQRPANWQKLLEELGLAEKRSTRYGLMRLGEQRDRLAPAITSLLATAHAALRGLERPFQPALPAGVEDTGSVRQRGERLDAKVNPGFLPGRRKRLHGYVGTGKTHIPTIRFPSDGDGLRCSLQWARPTNGNAPDLGQDKEAVIQRGPIAELLVGEAVVAICGVEAGLARRLSLTDTTEEALKGSIRSSQ